VAKRKSHNKSAAGVGKKRAQHARRSLGGGAAHPLYSRDLAHAAIIGTGEKLAAGKFGKSLAPHIYKHAREQKNWIANERMATYERHQRKMWSWAVMGSIILFFALFVIEVGVFAGLWAQQGESAMSISYEAEMIGFVVLAIDVGARFRLATNKWLFVRQNWLEIIALVPFGPILRMGQALEAFGAMRILGTAAKGEELLPIIPGLHALRGIKAISDVEKAEVAAVETAGRAGSVMLTAQEYISRYSVVVDFVEKTGKALQELLRLGG